MRTAACMLRNTWHTMPTSPPPSVAAMRQWPAPRIHRHLRCRTTGKFPHLDTPPCQFQKQRIPHPGGMFLTGLSIILRESIFLCSIHVGHACHVHSPSPFTQVGKYYHPGGHSDGGAPEDLAHPGGRGTPPLADRYMSWSAAGPNGTIQFPDQRKYWAKWGKVRG